MTRGQTAHRAVGSVMGMALCALILLPGCGRMLNDQRQKDNPEFTVVPFSNSSAMALEADDVHRIMEIAGFTPPQIWDLALDVHNALKELGGAKIKMGKDRTEVIYATQGDLVWIGTRSRGFFVYDVKSKQFNLAPNAGSRSSGSPQQPQQVPPQMMPPRTY